MSSARRFAFRSRDELSNDLRELYNLVALLRPGHLGTRREFKKGHVAGSNTRLSASVAQGTEGRRAHVGVSAELDTVADEVVHVVKVMDGLNRYRFATDPERLAAWESASSVFAAPRTASSKPLPEGTPPAGGEIRPAA